MLRASPSAAGKADLAVGSHAMDSEMTMSDCYSRAVRSAKCIHRRRPQDALQEAVSAELRGLPARKKGYHLCYRNDVAKSQTACD